MGRFIEDYERKPAWKRFFLGLFKLTQVWFYPWFGTPKNTRMRKSKFDGKFK